MTTTKTIITFLTISLILLLQSCQEPTKQLIFPVQTLNVLIDSGSYRIGPCEPSIFINPAKVGQIVAGSVLNQVHRSNDTGRTWATEVLTSSFGVYGDPVITADTKGAFYFAHLSDPDHEGWASERLLDRIVVQRSDDGGKTWNEGGYAGLHHPKDQDKHWLVTDPKTQHVYMTWTEFDVYGSKSDTAKSRILFSKSIDKGENWSEAITLSEKEGDCIDDDLTTEGAVPAIGNNGEIYVSWSYDDKIYFDKSLDGGTTWLQKDKVVAKQPGGWTFDIAGLERANGMPIIGVHPTDGTIYVNWADQRNGEHDTDIWLASSKDKGETWSSPQRINNDTTETQQFFTWMSIDPITGAIYIVFYDRRNHTDATTDVYMAYSFNGGTTFTNQKISTNPFTPKLGSFFGDYNNVSAYNGIVRPIWTRSDSTKLSVWTALINVQ